jgi:hypothetical protein
LGAIAGITQALSGIAQQAGGAAPNSNIENAIYIAAGGKVVDKTLKLTKYVHRYDKLSKSEREYNRMVDDSLVGYGAVNETITQLSPSFSAQRAPCLAPR